MAQELPYFRFTVAEWLSGDIHFEDYETKGLFIDICAYYWFKDCTMSQALLEHRFSQAKARLEALYFNNIIKIRICEDTNEKMVEITFLDLQYDNLMERHNTLKTAGSKGGKARLKGGLSQAKAGLKPGSSYKDKDKDKNIHKDFFVRIVSRLNEITGSSYKPTSINTTKHIGARLKEGYTYEDFDLVIRHRNYLWKDKDDMSQYLRPETLFGSKFENYLNAAKSAAKQTKKEYIP